MARHNENHPPVAAPRSVRTPRTIAQKLYDLADAMQKDIDAKLNPAIASQNMTPRRVRIAQGMRQDGHRLELVQRSMRRMAEWHEWTPQTRVADPLRSKYADLDTRKAFEGLKTSQLEELAGGPRVETEAEKVAKLEATLVGTKIPGFFPTPNPVIRTMLTYAQLARGQRVLEPSAGKGDIADAIKAAITQQGAGLHLDLIEINHTLRGILDAKGYHVLPESDFLAYRPTYQYDRILMNPPFEKLADIDHVRHAFELLAPGGRLVAIVGEGSFVRNDKRAEDFRAWVKESEDDGRAEVIKLPDGSFSGAASFRQTGVNCRLVVLDKAEATCADKTSHRPAPPVRPPSVPPPTPPPGPRPSHAQLKAAEIAEEEAAAEAANAGPRRTRADVDWKAAGLKAWATRRAREQAAQAGGGA